MKYFINYASNGFQKSQSEALRVAGLLGFTTIGYSEKDIEPDFFEKNKEILTSPRGGGYWLWKPHLIYKTLNKINFGDYLIYMDAGAIFVKDPDPIIKLMDNRGLLAFQLIHKTSKYTKGDCFYFANDDDKDLSKDLNQINATYIFFRKTEFVMKFVEEWLQVAQNKNAITDMPNEFKENFDDFIDHRHDQAIFSLLAHKHKVMHLPQIDQYCYENDLDPGFWQFVNVHRFRG